MDRIEDREETIDLGAVSVETKGQMAVGDLDSDEETRFIPTGISAE